MPPRYYQFRKMFSLMIDMCTLSNSHDTMINRFYKPLAPGFRNHTNLASGCPYSPVRLPYY